MSGWQLFSPLLSDEVGPMEDFRDAKSADILYKIGDVFVPLHHQIYDTNQVVIKIIN